MAGTGTIHVVIGGALPSPFTEGWLMEAGTAVCNYVTNVEMETDMISEVYGDTRLSSWRCNSSSYVSVNFSR